MEATLEARAVSGEDKRAGTSQDTNREDTMLAVVAVEADIIGTTTTTRAAEATGPATTINRTRRPTTRTKLEVLPPVETTTSPEAVATRDSRAADTETTGTTTRTNKAVATVAVPVVVAAPVISQAAPRTLPVWRPIP
uniref:Uncharacterized protein n=1 Tax=Cacopsylla melanoneura TaxID=428564 RepID=A0A8D9BKL7_9HEMI